MQEPDAIAELVEELSGIDAAWFRFENDALERKVTALESQASQTAPLIADLGPAMFRAFIADEYFREAVPDDHDGPV